MLKEHAGIIEDMLEKMNLQAHEDKSGAIILGYHDSNRKFEH